MPRPERARKPVTARRSRAVSPATAISQSHEDKKNIKAFITMAIVTCVVACIALGVYYFMVYDQH